MKQGQTTKMPNSDSPAFPVREQNNDEEDDDVNELSQSILQIPRQAVDKTQPAFSIQCSPSKILDKSSGDKREDTGGGTAAAVAGRSTAAASTSKSSHGPAKSRNKLSRSKKHSKIASDSIIISIF